MASGISGSKKSPRHFQEWWAQQRGQMVGGKRLQAGDGQVAGGDQRVARGLHGSRGQ